MKNNRNTIKFATSTRGFMRHLFNNPNIEVDFIFDNNTFEAPKKLHLIGSRLIRSKIFNVLGIIQRISRNGENVDIYGSCNRFLKTDKPYFIYVENPTALFHYSLGKAESFLGSKNLKKYLADKNLKALTFWSNASRTTFENVCGKPLSECIMKTIYPLIPDNKNVSEFQIKNKHDKHEVDFLYIAQGIRFLSKGEFELIDAFEQLSTNGYKCNLTMITNLTQVSSQLTEKIKSLGINLLDFSFPYSELEKIYANHDVLLQPTSDDSFGLTILEAMKAGLPVIGSKLYAIPEMVVDGYNGFLVDPHYWFFDKDNLPNPDVWNHRKETIYSGKKSGKLTKDLVHYMAELIDNRNLLLHLSLNSYKRSHTEPFSEEYIVSQWNSVFHEIID